MLVGEQSGHFLEVMRITAKLNAWQFIFKALEPGQVASLVWQIFMDAHRFFSTRIDLQGNLPQSLLQTTYNKVAIGIVQAHLSMYHMPNSWAQTSPRISQPFLSPKCLEE
jgi:hypothetical protein